MSNRSPKTRINRNEQDDVRKYKQDNSRDKIFPPSPSPLPIIHLFQEFLEKTHDFLHGHHFNKCLTTCKLFLTNMNIRTL